MPAPRFAQVKETTLNAPLLDSATEFTLKNLVDIYGNALDATDDFQDSIYFVFNPGGSREEIVYATGFTVNLDGSVTVDTGVARGRAAKYPYTTGGTAYDHPAGTIVVVSNVPQIYKAVIDYAVSIVSSGAADADDTTKGIVEQATQAEIDADTGAGGTAARLFVNPERLATSKYGTRLPSAGQKIFLNAMTGVCFPYLGNSVPTGFLSCDGTAYDNDTYPELAAVALGRWGYGTASTFTATAGTDTINATSHGLSDGNIVFFTSTTTLPAGLSANTVYYVINSATNTFKVSTSSGGSAVDITDAGTGTHSFYNSFKVPDYRGRSVIGKGATTFSLDFLPADVDTGTDTITVASNKSLYNGARVQLTTTGALPTGLSLATDYYVIRASATTIQLAAARTDAVGGNTTGATGTNTAINITGTGSGTHTLTVFDLTTRSLGDVGGEENHFMTIAELTAHKHTQVASAGATSGSGGGPQTLTSNTGSTGGDGGFNIMDPFGTAHWIVKT